MTFLILQKNFLIAFSVENEIFPSKNSSKREIITQKGQNMSRDTLVNPLRLLVLFGDTVATPPPRPSP